MADAADVVDLARDCYEAVSPSLGCHAPCREFALLAVGAAAALGIPCQLVYHRSYTEDGITDQHFVVRFENRRMLDLWQREARLR